MIKSDLPDQIAHGFLQTSALHAMPLGKIRCYQYHDFHTGFTLFTPDEQTSVYVQMYGLPDGLEKLEEDLAFQTKGKKWGKPPKTDTLQLKIFPPDWTHSASSTSPKRTLHQYRGPTRALFIRYLGNSLTDPLFNLFNDHLKYLPNDWHTELTNHELALPAKPYVQPPATTVDTIDLRTEQSAIRQMILNGINRFASEQRSPNSDLHNLPVTGIILWLDVGNGYASVHFDVRSPFENDGSYSHQEYSPLPRDNWRQFVQHLFEGHPVTLTGLDGVPIQITPKADFNLDEAFGLMILDLLKTLRTEKAFSPLLLAPTAELIIEADDFAYAWPPRHEDRGKENLINGSV
jgi:hypothetical protein